MSMPNFSSSPEQGKNSAFETPQEEKIIFPMIPDEIHKVPDSIRKAIKVGKFRKNLTYNCKPPNPEEPPEEEEQGMQFIGTNLHVRKIFNFMPRRKSNLPQQEEPVPEREPKRQLINESPLKSDPAARYFRSDAFKIRNSSGGAVLYIKKKLSPLKKGLTVEPRSIVSRDKRTIKVTFLNIEKMELAKMYNNIEEPEKNIKSCGKRDLAMASSLYPNKNQYMVDSFLESTTFSVKTPVLKRSFYSSKDRTLKMKLKPFSAPFDRYHYRDFIWKVALSNHIQHEAPEAYDKKIKVFIGRGNNCMLVKSLIKRRRAWMTFTDRYEQANVVWSQIKFNDIFTYQKNQAVCSLSPSLDCPEANFEGIPEQSQYEMQEVGQFSSKKTLTVVQRQNLNILSAHDLAHWEKYFSRFRKAEDLLDEGMKRRNKAFFSNNKVPCREIKAIDTQAGPRSFRIHNHLPNNYIIGNKKALFYTMSRYYQAMGVEVFEYLPLTFHIQNGLEDNQYLKFLNHYYARAKIVRAREKNSKNPQAGEGDNSRVEEEEQPSSPSRTPVRNMWIVKPGEFSNRGNGITVCMNLQEIKSILKKKQRHDNGNLKTYIIQSYIQKPFLYQRRKFDIRHYMMITSINGNIKGYWYEDGYIRTTSFEYSIENSLTNVHLTNDAVQKYLPEYGKYEKGNKVSYSDFQKYLGREYQGKYSFYEQIYPKMKKMATDAIRACSTLIDPQRKGHNFEIFGMDFMIDADFHPWLIEINNNPCLEISCNVLKEIIPSMLENMFRIGVDSVIPPPAKFTEKKPKFNDNALQENKFQLVYDSVSDEASIRKLFEGCSGLDLDYRELEKDQDEVFDDDGMASDGD